MTTGQIGSDPAMAQRKRELAEWVNIEKSIVDQVDRFTAEHRLDFAGGAVEVRQFSWSKPVESVWTTESHCYLLHLSLDGKGPSNVVTNLKSGRNAASSMGALALVPPGQALSCLSDAGSSRAIRCLLDARLLESFLADLPEWHDGLLHEAFSLSGGQIEWLIRRMYRELSSPDFGTEAMLATFAQQLAVEIVRKFELRSVADFRRGGMAPWRLQRLRDRLYADDPLPDLAELAELCDMTVRHLARAFRTETGQTLGKYRETVMVERATPMLREGSSVAEIAGRLGFSSPGGFRSAFRRATGMLPSEIKATN